ncbi:uncharacterized protein LOC123665434 [Melitaea cinxia]|uniref:uncharacterized protein LOC123665434 n=1 Tax=Melitaea cinxia TaxID=113334 RepID=UPI001E274CBD|nr:uncharacterized protein LOC123665434 [Melitaea cinxia]
MELSRVSTLLAILLVTGTLGLPALPEDDSEVNLEPGTDSDDMSSPSTCTAKNGQQGICVPESYCTEDQTIAPGGVLHSSEYRELQSNVCKSLEWCCTEERQIDTPQVRTDNVDSCLPPDGDIFPWIVSLYKVHNSTAQSAQAAFCLGTLIGSKVVLTAGTCMAAAQHHMLYASLPRSNDPMKNYTVRFRKAHPMYNTGSHAFDYSILVLDEYVTFGDKRVQGACLAFEKPQGQCAAIGIDGNENLFSTLVNVTSDVCDSFGGRATNERVCTKNADVQQCLVATGSPLVCQSKSEKGVVVGVTRTTCVKDQVLVGSLEYATWITDELNAMKISKDVYLEK